jgi:hypothetical protein
MQKIRQEGVGPSATFTPHPLNDQVVFILTLVAPAAVKTPSDQMPFLTASGTTIGYGGALTTALFGFNIGLKCATIVNDYHYLLILIGDNQDYQASRHSVQIRWTVMLSLAQLI